MTIKLNLPYNPVGELAGNENDMSDEEYANELMRQFGSDYNNFMNNAMYNMTNDTGVMDLMPDQYQVKSVQDTRGLAYYTFTAFLNDMDDQPMTTENLLRYVNTNDMAAFFVHLAIEREANPDADEELRMWLKDCKDIMKNPHIDDAYRVGMVPPKDLIIDAEGMRYQFVGARVIDQDNPKNFAIIVNKVKKL